MSYRPLLLFPALAVMFVVAIVFFNVYGRASRAEVPLAVSATLDHYAPGVAIGSTVRSSASGLRGVAWVPNVGFVGTPRRRREFDQVRLYPSAAERVRSAGNRDATVRVVELVAADDRDMSQAMTDLGIVFRTAPRNGCIVPQYQETPYRRVFYWTTSDDRGGVALLNDWAGRDTRPSPLSVWSIVAWAGPFKGSETLLARFEPRSCRDIAGR